MSKSYKYGAFGSQAFAVLIQEKCKRVRYEDKNDDASVFFPPSAHNALLLNTL